MNNNNLWDWENEREHVVSSVYRDMEPDAEALKPQRLDAQNAPMQNNEEQTAREQALEVQTNAEQNIEQKVEQCAEAQTNIIQNADTELTNTVPEEVVTENNFILVDNPQNTAQSITPQTEVSYAQTESSYAQTQHQQANYQQTQYQQTQYQQPNFQQIIPIQNTQQNQGTRNQNTNQRTNHSARFHQNDISENKVSAIAAYLLGPIGIIIALLIARDSAYTAFHVREALKMTICSVILEVFAAIFAAFGMIPFVGIIFKMMLILTAAALAGIWILRLIAIAQVSNGEAKEPAIIRNFTFLK